MTKQQSCEVQSFVEIIPLNYGLEHNEMSIHYELWLKNLKWNGL